MANYFENQNYHGSFRFGSADYTGSEAVKQNLVEGYLKDGYPVLKNGNGTSLNGLLMVPGIRLYHIHMLQD